MPGKGMARPVLHWRMSRDPSRSAPRRRPTSRRCRSGASAGCRRDSWIQARSRWPGWRAAAASRVPLGSGPSLLRLRRGGRSLVRRLHRPMAGSDCFTPFFIDSECLLFSAALARLPEQIEALPSSGEGCTWVHGLLRQRGARQNLTLTVLPVLPPADDKTSALRIMPFFATPNHPGHTRRYRRFVPSFTKVALAPAQRRCRESKTVLAAAVPRMCVIVN